MANKFKEFALASVAVLASALFVFTIPKVYDYSIGVRNKVTQVKRYSEYKDISEISHYPENAKHVYSFTKKDVFGARVLDGGDFNVGIIPVAVLNQNDNYFLELKFTNYSEDYLIADFKTRGYLIEDPPGCPIILPAEKYKIPKGKEYDIYVEGTQLEKGWLWDKDGKIRLKINLNFDSPEEGGFREIVLELPASDDLEDILTY